jgi:hypothetical protein
VKRSFVGPMRVSLMVDPNGANTTAAAAVLAACRHVDLSTAAALVLPGTGPVGQRAVRLLAREGTTVHVGSRRFERAQQVCERVWELVEGATLVPHATGASDGLSNALKDVQVVIAAGAAGVEVLPIEIRQANSGLRVAIDLNAVPPVGIAGMEVVDKGTQRDGTIAYGAIGVGGMKMKIHRAAIRRLFETNVVVLDAEQIYAIGRELEAS